MQNEFLFALEKLRIEVISLVISTRLSVRTSTEYCHEKIKVPLGEYSWNLMLENFLKICHENSCVIKIRKYLRVIYMKTYVC
jgi:hypothetical protein